LSLPEYWVIIDRLDNEHNEEVLMDRSVVLAVGDTCKLGSGKDHITYAGMISDKAYSIVQRKRKFGPYMGWGFAWNLFYPREQTRITIDDVGIQVENVTPQEIRLRI
jgi:hypothetical protein